jgi:two-component system, NarL family, invasion response regulator UvrY
MNPHSLHLLIVDDHPLFRLGLKDFLLGSPDVVDVDEASSGAEVMQKMDGKTYDCIVLAISLPGENGLAVLGRILKRNPRAQVIIYSMYPEDQYGIRSLKAGAACYLSKKSDPELLKEAIHKVTRGERFIVPTLAEKLGEEALSGRVGLPHDRLSDREHQVLLMIAAGKTVSEIAAELKLSVKTVSTHRAHILEKMSLRNNSELIRYAITSGLAV